MTGGRDPSPPAATTPALPWRIRLLISFFTLVNRVALRSDGSVNRRLFSFFDSPVSPSPKPIRGVRTADVAVDPARNLWFRLFLPAAAAATDGCRAGRLPVFVFFHGGGFILFSPSSKLYDDVCRWFCLEIPAAVVSVNYRLSPEHRCPAAYEDGLDVLRFLASRRPLDEDRWWTTECSIDASVHRDAPPPEPPDGPPLLREFFLAADLSSCFVVGDSAGGNIAHHVARRWSAGDQRRVALAGLVALQPFFGGEERVDSEIRHAGAPMVNTKWTDWMWRAFLPEGAGRDHQAASPEWATAGLGEGFPPAMVVTGGFDPLLDWQRRYYEGLRKAGTEAGLAEYPASSHGFFAFPELEDTQALVKVLKGFVQEQQRKKKQQQQGGDRDVGSAMDGNFYTHQFV